VTVFLARAALGVQEHLETDDGSEIAAANREGGREQI
jgi:hypothetical protein